MLLLSVFFHLQNHVSVFWNFNFWSRYLAEISLCPWYQPHFLRNSDKSLLSPENNNLKKSETRFCRWKTAEDNNAKLNVFHHIPCTFLLFKVSVFLQIFFQEIYFSDRFTERQFFSIVNGQKHQIKEPTFLYLLIN